MSHYVATHNDEGLSVISQKIPTGPHSHDMPIGSMDIIYSTHTFPADISSESDIDQYAHDRTHGIENGFCPPGGIAAAILQFEPHAISPMHRTMTMDIMVVMEGIVELHLDGGEVRTLKAGDSIVQRGTMHMWKNVTPNNGLVKAIGQ